MSLTHHQRIASFQLSYMLAMINHLLDLAPPKSAIHNRLRGLEDKTNQCLDFYRIHRMSRADLDRAVKLFDRLDTEISELYPTSQRKRQVRRRKRHSQCRVRRTLRTSH